MADKIAVYSPTGNEEFHTLANARDLVNGAKYTWKRGIPASPVETAPFALPPEKAAAIARGKPISQEIFDRFGSGATEDILAPKEEAIDEVVETAPEAPAAPEVVETTADAASEEEVSVDLPRRGRPRKNS